MAFLHPSSLCILTALLVSSYTLTMSSLASPSPPPPLNCATSRCGTISNISFPFGFDVSSTNSCSLPEFHLTCNDNLLGWQPLDHPNPISSILNIISNHITSGTFVAGPHSSSPVSACSPPQQNQLFSSSHPHPFGIQFSPYDNIRLLTNCSRELTDGFNVSETVDGFSFSSPNCISYYSVCSNQSSTRVHCLEAISADANISHMLQRYECKSNISLYELPKKAGSALSVQILWTISQSYYDCIACKGSNGSCTVDNITNSFRCFCANDISPSNICSSAETFQSCKGLCHGYDHFFLGATAIAVAILIVGIIFGVYCCHRRARLGEQRQPLPMSTLESPIKDHLKQILECEESSFTVCTRKFTYEDLYYATDGFAESKVLGDGGFGMVYEGTLTYSAEKVAVKRLFAENARRIEQFLNEIRILSTLNHPNLVRLHGFCCESYTELLLVYEFASNGSLADNLHGKPGGLSWETRVRIAMETARALAYMHERDPPILHRDVKSSNILLDGSFHAKLADFGLSRRAYEMKGTTTHVSTAPQGTPGYVDPQYQQCYRLTEKSDVYSFGVVLMELISGKAPIDMSRRHTDHINLSSLAVAKIQTGALHELIDPFLLQGCSVADLHKTVASVAELAFLCLAPLQDDRPSMSHVALTLLEITLHINDTLTPTWVDLTIEH